MMMTNYFSETIHNSSNFKIWCQKSFKKSLSNAIIFFVRKFRKTFNTKQKIIFVTSNNKSCIKMWNSCNENRGNNGGSDIWHEFLKKSEK